MSYTRKYHERIPVYYSGSVSYPASESGGSVSYSGTTYEDIYVNLLVDTNPFDHSIRNCNGNVRLLTGAVGATETAQIASIDKNSRKVAGTVVDGFFSLIRFEMGQEMVKLAKEVDSKLMLIRSLAQKCQDKQRQMDVDYHRITERYLKIFDDLNRELENRIYALNEPAFRFKERCGAAPAAESDLVSTVAVFGREGGGLQAKISASIAKKRAMDTIGRINTFLWKQNLLQATIKNVMLNENVATARYSPVCYVETHGEGGRVDKKVFRNAFLADRTPQETIDKFKGRNWKAQTREQRDNIRRFFNAEVDSACPAADKHGERVKNTILGLFDADAIKSV